MVEQLGDSVLCRHEDPNNYYNEVPIGRWSVLRVLFNGERRFEVEDQTITPAVKQAPKADSLTYFNEFTIIRH